MSTAVRTLYVLVYSNCLAPFAVSSAWKHDPETFVLSRILNRPSAGNLMKVYLLTAQTLVSANFRLTEFSEVRMDEIGKFGLWATPPPALYCHHYVTRRGFSELLPPYYRGGDGDQKDRVSVVLYGSGYCHCSRWV